MRSERFTEPQEIKRILSVADEKNSGPILFYDNGTMYCDTSESHVLISGRTRSGKSSTEAKSFVRSEVEAGNCVVAIDPKEEFLRSIIPHIKKTYNICILDLRHPSRSPDRWDPIESASYFFKSSNVENKDIASSMISEFASALFPCDANSDPFWPNASTRLLEGCIYSLLEICNDEYCNLRSIVSMFEKLETKIGGSFLLKEFANLLPDDSLARKAVSTYITGPNETRASIHSVASAGIAPFSRSNGIMRMLSNGTIKIHELDVDRPFFVDVILPDENSVYSSIAGLFVSQVTQHLIRLAEDKYNGRLPRRTTIFIEELSSVSSAINNLPHLMSTALGRNIRMCLVLQDPYSQLQTAFGEAKAKAIQANVGVTVAFSTNDWNSLNALSSQIGEREVEWDGRIIKEPLITPHQLGALNTGCCLVLLQNRYKWITKLPFYEDAYHVNKEDVANYAYEVKPIVCESKTFDMEEYVKNKRQERMESMMKEREKTPSSSNQNTVPDIDMNDLLGKLEKKIAEVEQEEQRAKQELAKEMSKHAVRIEKVGTSKRAIEALFAASQHIYEIGVLKQITAKLPILLFFDTADEAEVACKYVNALPGAKAVCENKE